MHCRPENLAETIFIAAPSFPQNVNDGNGNSSASFFLQHKSKLKTWLKVVQNARTNALNLF